MTSLHVPPTHPRVNMKALVELQELAISLCVSCLREEPVDTRVSWTPNTTDSDPRYPQFRAIPNAYRHRSSVPRQQLTLLRVSEDLALYRIKPVCPADLSNNIRNKILAIPQARCNHPDRSQSSRHPRIKAEYVLPIDGKAGVTFIGPEAAISTGR